MAKTKITIQREWETIYFTATNSFGSQTIELNINHKTGKYDMCNGHEESVSFKDSNIETTELKIEALKEAVKFLKLSPLYTQIK